MKETYEEFCERRLRDNCMPIPRLNWETGMSDAELLEYYKMGTKI